MPPKSRQLSTALRSIATTSSGLGGPLGAVGMLVMSTTDNFDRRLVRVRVRVRVRVSVRRPW